MLWPELLLPEGEKQGRANIVWNITPSRTVMDSTYEEKTILDMICDLRLMSMFFLRAKKEKGKELEQESHQIISQILRCFGRGSQKNNKM